MLKACFDFPLAGLSEAFIAARSGPAGAASAVAVASRLAPTQAPHAAARAAAVARSAKKGFGSAPTAAAPASTVSTPEGGWPELSLLVVGRESKSAKLVALEQLALQDYPTDKIKEIVIYGADEVASSAPDKIKGLLKDFSSSGLMSLSAELSALSGEFVAVWGDDHVSSADRLQAQVAAALSGEGPTVLQPTWFYDVEDTSFLRVTSWPEVGPEAEQEMSLPAGFVQLMVCADPLSLCGTKQAIAGAAAKVQPSDNPADSLKELMLGLQAKKPVKVMEDVEWAALRAPPSVTKYEESSPQAHLAKLARDVRKLDPVKSGKGFPLAATLEAIKKDRLDSVAAVRLILEQDAKRPLSQLEQKRLSKALFQLLNDASGADTVKIISELSEWYGLEPGNGDAKAVRNFPMFYSVFSALRAHVQEDADLFDSKTLGPIAEGLVTLGQKIWAVDEKVSEVLASLLISDVTGEDEGADRGMVTADIMGTLGLRECMETIARAGIDSDTANAPVSSLASLARALAEVGVESTALQLKVAKGVINGSDKLTPPDIGNLWVALHEKQWFKEDQTIAYLTESMLRRVQEMKKNDPSLAAALAASQ